MKIHPQSSQKSSRAATLLAAMLLSLIVAALLASYLLIVQNEYTKVARSQTWNQSLMMTDAGVEEALAFINKYEGTVTEVYEWTNPVTAAEDGWTVNGNVYSKTNTVNPNYGYYSVYITNINNAPVITSIGTVYWNLDYASVGLPFLAAAGVSVSPMPVAREILVKTKLDTLMPGALVALSTIDLKGNNIMVDSFDSRDPLHSDWQTNITYQGSNYGFYPLNDPIGKREAKAVVATDTNIINVGNAEVYGYADTAPGGLVAISKNGSVGDTNWIGTDPSSPNNHGIQSGHARDDMNVIFPNVVLPSANWTLLLPALNTNFGSAYQYVITNSGNYEINTTLESSLYVGATNVTLYLPGGLSYNSGDVMTIGSNADLTVYSGDAIRTSGQGEINNVNQIALALSFFGLPSGIDGAGDLVNGCTTISVGGNGAGTSFVYAPQASLSFNGGGSSVYNVVGAYIVHDIQLNGSYNFHYDQALATRGPHRGFIPSSWKEVYGQ